MQSLLPCSQIFNKRDGTNGILGESFVILPFYDVENPKKTWDSIERANDIETTKFSITKEMLDDFIVIGHLSGLSALLASKKDGIFWFEDKEGFNKLNIDFISLLKKLMEEE